MAAKRIVAFGCVLLIVLAILSQSLCKKSQKDKSHHKTGLKKSHHKHEVKHQNLLKDSKLNAKSKKYIRLRTSSKHKGKLKKKTVVNGTLNEDKKRSKITGKDQMNEGAFHLATNDVLEDQRASKRYHMEEGHHLNERPILGRCDINKQCKSDQYCEGIYCYKCRKAEEHCYANGQCCKGAECQYGYCAGGVSAGMPGTYCDKSKDCRGSDQCCILEMSVDHHNPICKPMLEEHETCGPINLFHQISTEFRAQNEPVCGPCKQGLACKSVGIHGHHSICLPEGGD